MTGRPRYTEQQYRESFEAKYIPEPNSGCWLWTANCNVGGYGILKYQRKNRPAHRLSWRFYRGEIPTGLLVCHKCDTPACVNPDHLFLGTPTDSQRDCSRKGRKFNQQKTHCKSGHPLSGDNLRMAAGKRTCIKCAYAINARWRYSPSGRKYMISRRK
jgi:hypothetical protein